jgi:hypothetical protein
VLHHAGQQIASEVEIDHCCGGLIGPHATESALEVPTMAGKHYPLHPCAAPGCKQQTINTRFCSGCTSKGLRATALKPASSPSSPLTLASAPTVTNRKKVVFESQVRDGGAPLTMDDRSERLLDHLIALCESRPGYLLTEEAARYEGLLGALKEAKLPRGGWKSETVAELPIKDLGRFLPSWIESYFNRSVRLMPHYALDTTEFIRIVVEGHSFIDPERWEIAPLFRTPLNVSANLDSSFLRGFTRKTQCAVQAVVPPDVNVRNHWSKTFSLNPGDSFRFHVRRCRLSHRWDYSYASVHASPDPSVPRFHLGGHFKLEGQIISGSERASLDFSLPAHWITDEIKVSQDEKGGLIDEPVPATW